MTTKGEALAAFTCKQRWDWIWLLALLLAVIPAGVEAQVCDRAAFAQLVRLSGEWAVVARDRGPELEFETTNGRARVTRSLGGCGLVMTYRGLRQGSEFEMVTVIALRSDGTLEMAGADSVHDGIQLSSGAFARGVLSFSRIRDMGDRVLTARTIYTVESPDAFSVKRELRRSEGDPWEVTYEAAFTRSGGTHP